MKIVTTKDGQMFVSGITRNAIGVLFDLYVGMFVMYALVAALRFLSLKHLSIEIVALVIILLYPLLAHKEIVPGIGRWALGLHRYEYSEVEEYNGSGTLIAYEKLASSEYSIRTVVAVIFFAALYFLATYVASLS